jgi:hypothetical protein
MARAKAGQAGALLIALNLRLGFAGDFGGWDFDRDLLSDIFLVCFRLSSVGSLCGAHVSPFTSTNPDVP